MGIDAEIYIEASEVADLGGLSLLGHDCAIRPVSEYDPPGTTHRVTGLGRYYEIGYERGDWRVLCAVLMELLSTPGVVRVWYDGDYCEGSPRECPPERVLEISRHYMAHGHRPYFEKR